MSHNIASNLPPRIIHTVMRYAANISEILETLRWKYILPFLSISRTWRIHSIPMVYRYAFYSDVRQSIMDPANTNIGLMLEGHYSCYAQMVTVYLENLECLERFLETYKSLFRFSSNDWGQVTRLRLAFRYNSTIPDRFASDELFEERECRFVVFVQDLIKHMPIINWLNIEYGDESSVGRTANRLLFRAFGRQLVYLDGSCITSFTDRQHLASLTSLRMRFNNAAEHLLPTINSRQLVAVFLLDVPPRFSWKCFCSGQDGSNLIVFNSLKSLCLNFVDGEEIYAMDVDDEDCVAEHKVYRVEFPKLKSLLVHNSVVESILCCTYVFPKELKELVVFRSFETLELIKQSGVRTTINTTVNLYQVTLDEENEFYEYTNWLYGSGNRGGNKTLTVHNCEFKFNWERMEWSSITVLELTECNLQTFKAILFYSPQLKQLRVDILVLEGEVHKPYGIVSEFVGNSSFSTILPSESLKHIYVWKIRDLDETFDHAVLLFQTMATHFRHLEKIGMPKELISSVMRYLDRNKVDYPHMEGINVVHLLSKWIQK